MAAELHFMYLTPVLEDYLSDYYPKHVELRFMFGRVSHSSGVLHYNNTASKQEILEALQNGYPFPLLNEKDAVPDYTITLQGPNRSLL